MGKDGEPMEKNGRTMEKSGRIIGKGAVYLLFLILMAALHWNMSLDISDDAIFAEELKNETLLEHISHLYFVTNGKVFTDTMAAVFTSLDPLVWKTLDTAMLFVIAVCAGRLFLSPGKEFLGCIAVLFLNFSSLPSAGYVASSVNYIWSAAALLAALLPLKYGRRMEGRPVFFFLCCAAALYAGSQEQSGAIAVTVYTLYITGCLFRKARIPKYIWVPYGTAILSLALLLTAPGHANKAASYNIFCIPDYLSLGFLEKAVRGFTSTAAVVVTGQTVVWPLFCFLLLLAVWMNRKDFPARLLSFLPLAGSLVLGNFQEFLPEAARGALSYRASWSFTMPDYRYIDASSYGSWQSYLPLAAALLILGLVFLEIFWAFGRGKTGACLFLTLAAGFCSRVVMGFSPTLYGAYYRTFLFLYLALGICIAMVLDRLLREGGRARAALALSAVLPCLLAAYGESLKSIM